MRLPNVVFDLTFLRVYLFLFYHFCQLLSDLPEWYSTKLCHMIGSERFKMQVQNIFAVKVTVKSSKKSLKNLENR